VSESTRELIERAAANIVDSSYAVALTGAGISTESGILDFRGPSGVWTKDPDAERRAYESYPKFLNDPRGFWEEVLTTEISFVQDMMHAVPNPGHRALVELETMRVLKWTITQNIDGLHEKAGSENLLEYHGSLFKLRCPQCNARFGRGEFDLDDMLREGLLPPRCTACDGALKPDIVFFGEPIPTDVAIQSEEEARKCDVMLVCGTSAVVYPFARLPRIAGRVDSSKMTEYLFAGWNAPAATIVEINAEPTPLTHEGVSSYLIQGKTGEILPRVVEAVKRLNTG